MLFVYEIFNRSVNRRRALKSLEKELGRLCVPRCLHEIRWSSKYLCLKSFYSSLEGIKQYIMDTPAVKNTVEGQAILDMIEDKFCWIA